MKGVTVVHYKYIKGVYGDEKCMLQIVLTSMDASLIIIAFV